MITPAEMIAIRAPTDLLRIGPGVGRLARLVLGPLAEHLDEPAQRDRRQDVFGLAAAEPEERRAEADRELLDLHAVPLGQEEVAQLVDEDDEPEAEGDLQDVPERSAQGLQRPTSCRAQASTFQRSSSVGRGSNV